jgi:glycosyltransferase involved in cell wall biosynthesis
MIRIAFIAPMKPPDHPVPSGDREMARQLITALGHAGYEVEIASKLRMLDKQGNAAFTDSLASQALAQADAMLRTWEYMAYSERPRAVFAYHVHYKAPDVVGPRLAQGLGVPYVIAEGSRAPKRANSRWARGHVLAERALDAADAILVMNNNDNEMLERARPSGQRLIGLPPFLDIEAWPIASAPARREEVRPLKLLAVAMMRPGDKFASYCTLASALARLGPRLEWTLDIAGDGPASKDVHALFAPFGARVNMLGLVEERETLAALYANADLLVWPAENEAYGMVFLEGALQGCPALAGHTGGVPAVVRHGETGVLVPVGNPVAFAEAIGELAAKRETLARMGRNAAAFVRADRSLAGAAVRLKRVIGSLIKTGPAR